MEQISEYDSVSPRGYIQSFMACSMASGKLHQSVLLIRPRISLPDAATDSTSEPLSAVKTAVPVSSKLWTLIYCYLYTNSSLFD